MAYALFVGEMLIDFIPNTPGPDGTPLYQAHPGGSAANAAIALARLGSSARFVGKLGKDSFGSMLLRVLQENRVDTRYVPFTTRGNTTMVLVALQEQGQREFLFYRQGTADTLLEASDLTDAAWTDVSLCYASSFLLSSEPARSATLAALEQAHRRGLPIFFDINARPTLWTSETALRETLARVVGQVDLLKLSAEEAHYLDASLGGPLDPSDDEGLRALGAKLLTRGPALVVITRGSLGALLMNDSHVVQTSASTLQAVDTTGAGDAFMGALLHRLIEQNWTDTTRLSALSARELQAVGTFANRAAGISCTRYGGIASLPTAKEVQEALCTEDGNPS